jgi:hypothetical protein
MPSVAITTAAMAGPITRVRLTSVEFSDTAFFSSSCPASSWMNDWRVGLSIEFTQPSRPASTKIIQSLTAPVTTRIARMSASIPEQVWVTYRILRLWKRSATTPPKGASTSNGRYCSAMTRPSAVPEWVI